jgi:hypothetical protein
LSSSTSLSNNDQIEVEEFELELRSDLLMDEELELVLYLLVDEVELRSD